MSELLPCPAPPPGERSALLRRALARLVPGWRPLAAQVLGAEARIDVVGVDSRGGAVIALVGGRGQDLALVAQGLAQRAWLAARLADWAQLAPGAGLVPEAGVRAWLLAPHFGAAALAAARCEPELQPALLRWLRDARGDTAAWIEPAGAPEPLAPALRGNGGAGFRSGLTAEDLDLTPEELAALER